MKRTLLILIALMILIPLGAQDNTAPAARESELPREDALLLYRQGQYQRAVEVCLEELKIYTADQVNKKMDAYSVMCWSLIRLGRYDDVIRYGKEALTVARYDQRIIETLGEAYFFKGDNQNALGYFERYTVLNPTGQWIQHAYYYMGEIYIRLGEFSHADIAFSTALYHSPNVAGWWSRLGYAKEMGEDPVGAEEAYRRAVTLQPGHEDALLGLERLQTNG